MELTITTPDGEVPGAVQPASLPALSETSVTFHVPIAGEWIFRVNDDDQISSEEVIPSIGRCQLQFVIDVGDSTLHCLRP